MRGFAIIAMLSLAAAQTEIPNYLMQWQEWKKQHGHAFVGDEEARRFGIFKKNVDTIYEYNSKNLSFQLGQQQFTHLDPDEFAQLHFMSKKPEKTWGDLPYLGRHVYTGRALEDAVDWTMKNAVTPIKNQGQCGSCWSFSTTGALEGAHAIKTGNLVSFSEQQLVDCDKSNMGCRGGLMDNAFAFTETAGLCTEASYPYTSSKGKCIASSCVLGLARSSVSGYQDVAMNDQRALMEALAKQPVSIAIEADKSVFQSYKSGVLSNANCGSKLDHGVLAVGYGTLQGTDYWKVKNSWGASWGMEGYVLIARGKSGKGECGLLSGPPSYPVVSGKPGPSPGPSPPTPTPPTPSPPTPGTTHYEKPPCQSGEVEASVQNANGSVCAPPCDSESAALSGQCPTDTPAGTTATPKCILQDSSTGQQYCALACRSTKTCPTGAKCALASIFSAGICVYPDDAAPKKLRTTLQLAKAKAESDVINI